MTSINGIDLGSVQSEESNKDSGLFQMPLPRSNSDDAILLDLFGAFRTISISGMFSGTEDEQKAFIDSIEGIANGAQSTSTYISSLGTSPKSYTVLIQSFRWTKNAAVINKLDYSLTLFEGGS